MLQEWKMQLYKKVYNYWLPNNDNHFERLIAKRIRAGGPAEYQDDVRAEAYRFVKEYNIAIDVGANIGFWTKPLLDKFKKVIAFEPVFDILTCLKKNTVGLNIEYNHLILSDQKTTADMITDQINTGNNYVDSSSFGCGKIPVNTIDNLNLPMFNLIKIDCQGHDYLVLKGAVNTLQKFQPVVVVEQEDNENKCSDLLNKLGAKKLSKVRKDYIYGW